MIRRRDLEPVRTKKGLLVGYVFLNEDGNATGGTGTYGGIQRNEYAELRRREAAGEIRLHWDAETTEDQ